MPRHDLNNSYFRCDSDSDSKSIAFDGSNSDSDEFEPKSSVKNKTKQVKKQVIYLSNVLLINFFIFESKIQQRKQP